LIAVGESPTMEFEKSGAYISSSVKEEWRASVFAGGAGRDRRSNLIGQDMNET